MSTSRHTGSACQTMYTKMVLVHLARRLFPGLHATACGILSCQTSITSLVAGWLECLARSPQQPTSAMHWIIHPIGSYYSTYIYLT